IGIMIVFSDHDQRQTLYRGKIHPLIKGARAGAAVTDVSEADNVLLLQAGAEQDAGHDRNHVAQMRNRANESLRHVTEMNVEVFSAGWPPGFGHVLGEDFARPNSFDETRPQIANDWRYEIVWAQRVGRSHGGSLLA